jgi:hypothetical protein
VTHVQICRPSTGKISKRTLSPETRFFAPLAFCTEGPNHYMAMVLAILWVCVSNMHSHVMVWALGAKSDFGGSWVTRMYVCTLSVQCQPITYKGLVLHSNLPSAPASSTTLGIFNPKKRQLSEEEIAVQYIQSRNEEEVEEEASATPQQSSSPEQDDEKIWIWSTN